MCSVCVHLCEREGMTYATLGDTFQTRDQLIGDSWCNWGQKAASPIAAADLGSEVGVRVGIG